MGVIDRTKVLHCPRCAEVMIYDKKMDFWQCPLCDGQFWEDSDKLTALEREKKVWESEEELQKRLRWSLSMQASLSYHPEPLPAGPPAPSAGGRGKSGKRKKAKRNAKLITERYLLE